MATTACTPRYVRKRKFRRMNRQQKLDRISWFLAWLSVAIVVVVSLVDFDKEPTKVVIKSEIEPKPMVFTLDLKDITFNGFSQSKSNYPKQDFDYLDEDPLGLDEDPLSLLFQELPEELSAQESFIPDLTNARYSGNNQALQLPRLEFALLCHFVLHETGQAGMSDSYYLGNPDIDFMQRCVAATVINAIKSRRFSETSVEEILLNSGHLGALGINTHEKLVKYLFKIDSLNDLNAYLDDFEFNDISALTPKTTCTRTKQNIMSLLNGSTSVDSDIIFEMGWQMYDSNGNLITDLDIIQKVMEKQCGKIEIVYSCVTVENYVGIIARKIW